MGERIAAAEHVEHLTDAVVRIQLPLPMDDLRVVNAYAVLGGDGIVLIDPGWADEPSEAVLLAALAELGFRPADVSRILSTHSHWDHYSRAVDWRERYGIPIALGAEESHTVTSFGAAAGTFPAQAKMLSQAGAHRLAREIEVVEHEPYAKGIVMAPPDAWLDGGDVIDCGETTLTVTETPGHTRGHVVFEAAKDGLLSSGDHILPRITPSIGFERVPEALPLRSYLGSLQLYLDRPGLRMLPAHGQPDGDVTARARELLAHHESRLALVASFVAQGSTTGYEVAQRMSWTRHDRTVDELGLFHGMAAVLEVVAHLELLAHQGELAASDLDGTRHYAPA
ncbi:MBL fold metallo-hydrolase [Amycolatopsis silviterrae]|uniref:MBL fold metallo-hydrolase n=1 Tax=Amycolatopsis silviterrae TaxID=1656914 RepID=A0ABW5HKF0_9PSEU